jgi:perosamine synthetase
MMTTPFIPVYRPDLSGNERAYLMEAFDSSWISSQGRFISAFESMFAGYVGLPHVASVSNGTVALHLALHCLDLGPGDEVIVPSFTYIASVNTIAQTGATPVFAEVRESDWLLDPEDVERRITPRTRAIMAVHLYGAPCDMDRLVAIADEHDLALVEDCAEALGTTLHGRHAGTFGRVATWSFFGNKTVTTGEGGMVGTSDPMLHRRMVMTKGQGQDPERRYWHPIFGFNYRMTNLCAAIGTAQLERIEPILKRKREIAAAYRERLSGLPVVFQGLTEGANSSNWLVSILLPRGTDRNRLMADMAEAGVETRPVFHCAHQMPHHARDLSLPVSEGISARGISLPSFPALADAEIEKVVGTLRQALAARG